MRKLMFCSILIGFIVFLALFVSLISISKDVGEIQQRVVEVQQYAQRLPRAFDEQVADRIANEVQQFSIEQVRTVSQKADAAVEEIQGATQKVIDQSNKSMQQGVAVFNENVEASKVALAQVQPSVTQFGALIHTAAEDASQTVKTRTEAALQQMQDFYQKELIGVRTIRGVDAEACFNRYLENPEGGQALLYLHAAIRKNPSELRYLEALLEATKRSGFTPAYRQEAQMMLAYALDEARPEAITELSKLANDFQAALIAEEERLEQEEDKSSDEADAEHFAQLRQAVEDMKGVATLAEEMKPVYERGVEALQELAVISPEEADSLTRQAAQAQFAVEFITIRARINQCLQQAQVVLGQLKSRAITSEDELVKLFEDLQKPDLQVPLVMAQQNVQMLYSASMTQFTTDFVKLFRSEADSLDADVDAQIVAIDTLKADVILKYIEPQIPVEVGDFRYTDLIVRANNLVQLIAKYMASVNDKTAVARLLDTQKHLIAQSTQWQRMRLERYQSWALDQLKHMMEDMQRNEDNLRWRHKVEQRKNNAEGILRDRLSKIDRNLLSPEVAEVYQDVYNLAMKDYSAWVEEDDEERYPRFRQKADLLFAIHTQSKRRLEDL